MQKRVLLVDTDPAFVDRVTEALRPHEVSVASVSDLKQAFARARLGRPDVIVAGEIAHADALAICDAMRQVRMVARVPTVAVCRGSIAAADVNKHRESSMAARVYVTPPGECDDVVRAVLLLLNPTGRAESVPPIEIDPSEIETLDAARRSVRPPAVSRPPAMPRALQPRTDHDPRRSIPAPRVAARAEGVAMASAAAVRVEHAEPAIVTERPQSAEMPAFRVPTPTTSAASGTQPAATGSRPSLETISLRREITELRARSGDAQQRLSRAEQQVASLQQALDRATREREEADVAWGAWVTSAEAFANDAWHEREVLATDHARMQTELAAVRAESTQRITDAERARDEANARTRAAVEAQDRESARRQELERELAELCREIDEHKREVDFLLAEMDRLAHASTRAAKPGR